MKTSFAFVVLSALVSSSSAQQKMTPRSANTTISGHVYCADTNAPARMASVILQPVDQMDTSPPVMTSKSPRMAK